MKFDINKFYDAISWPVFGGFISDGQQIGIVELLDYCENWTPAELSSALTMAYHRTDGGMRDAIIRRQKYREPVVNDRTLEAALGSRKMADTALAFQDALIMAEWGE